jgi:hypothetical protein
VIRKTGTYLIRSCPRVTMIALVIKNATDPAAKTSSALSRVANERIRSASLSVNSTMKSAVPTVRSALITGSEDIGKCLHLS